jgi:hypothetical protein
MNAEPTKNKIPVQQNLEATPQTKILFPHKNSEDGMIAPILLN